MWLENESVGMTRNTWRARQGFGVRRLLPRFRLDVPAVGNELERLQHPVSRNPKRRSSGRTPKPGGNLRADLLAWIVLRKANENLTKKVN